MVQRIGHYRLEEELGRGGFGVVYRGIHVEMPELQVAVKVFHPWLSGDSGFQGSLRKECLLLARLGHEGIVGFRDLWVEGERTAVVFELLEGETFAEIATRGPMDPEDLRPLLEDVLRALEHAHGRGVVHRDIKPANIFRCENGRAKVADFGISRALEASATEHAGRLVGSWVYMAPERFRASSVPASDLYALGLVAWELLAGRRACPAQDLPSIMGWHMDQPVVFTPGGRHPSRLAEKVGTDYLFVEKQTSTERTGWVKPRIACFDLSSTVQCRSRKPQRA